MTQKKPIVDNGIILFDDYDYLFNFLSDEDLGKTIRLLKSTRDNPTLNPTDNNAINNVYNYIMGRIIDYRKTRAIASEHGKRGGNPALKTLKGTLNPTLKLKEKNIIEKKRKKIDSSAFDLFWKEYPRRGSESRKQTLEAWNKSIKKTSPENIMSHLEVYKTTDDVKRGYQVQAQRWLDREMWDVELPAKKKTLLERIDEYESQRKSNQTAG